MGQVDTRPNEGGGQINWQTKNNWFNNGPNIDAGYFQIVSTELDETNDYKLIALVPDNDEKTATL